ncbi:MAG TPA: hypothetical protein VHM01_13225 [Alphaproteobacteria bacterium]|nr:hypothetical protein [Alphaproteobacteria bacterium]
MTDTKDKPKPGNTSHGAWGELPETDKDALKRYRDSDQLQPQGSKYPADKRPTDPDAVEASDLPERDKQYGGDDN